eukprot:TRINITY_DN62087_c0_g1_i1.p1 TRINITY_DN62087_c0_g1~~TRINITY_DN62087_c0_g1_i1.p1  ORF type:complete len:678 (-),score=54.11 TRINITY_DN62087_c0_g1_i1:1126-3159(-)
MAERLYSEGMRFKKEQKEYAKQMKEWRVQSECTFRPQTNTNSSTRSRWKSSPHISCNRVPDPAEEDKLDEECTFQPQINRVSEDMIQAQLYLDNPAHERLYTQRNAQSLQHGCTNHYHANDVHPHDHQPTIMSQPPMVPEEYPIPRDTAQALLEIRNIERLLEQGSIYHPHKVGTKVPTQTSAVPAGAVPPTADASSSSSTNQQPAGDQGTALTDGNASPMEVAHATLTDLSGTRAAQDRSASSHSMITSIKGVDCFNVPETEIYGPTKDDNDNQEVLFDSTGRLYTSTYGQTYLDNRGNLYVDLKYLKDKLGATCDAEGNVIAQAGTLADESNDSTTSGTSQSGSAADHVSGHQKKFHQLTSTRAAKSAVDFQINGGYVTSNYIDSDASDLDVSRDASDDGLTPIKKGSTKSGGENSDAQSGGVEVVTSTGNVINWNEFLSRQNYCEYTRQERLCHTRDVMQGTHQPELCAHSIKLTKRTTEVDEVNTSTTMTKAEQKAFLARQARHIKDKEQHRAELQTVQDKGLTFKPKITDAAKKTPAKTADELSRVDPIKRKQRLEELRDVETKREMAQATFQPNCNAVRTLPKNMAHLGAVKSGLRLKEDIGSYVSRLQAKKNIEEQQVAEAKDNRIKEETQECTFKPKTRAAPAYIKRMAQARSTMYGPRTNPTPRDTTF